MSPASFWESPQQHLRKICTFSVFLIVTFLLWRHFLLLPSSAVKYSSQDPFPAFQVFKRIQSNLPVDGKSVHSAAPSNFNENAGLKKGTGSAFSKCIKTLQRVSTQQWLFRRSRMVGSEAEQGVGKVLIDGALPTMGSLPASSPLAKEWDAIMNGWMIDDLTEPMGDRISGIPGTAIDTVKEASELQSYLDCTSGLGFWIDTSRNGPKAIKIRNGLTVHKQEEVYASCDKKFYRSDRMPEHSETPWDVRQSLKWKWVPSKACARATSTLPSPPSVPISRKRLCALLAHKQILVVGDTSQYSLHDMLLDWTTVKPVSCYGDLYCTLHPICGDILRQGSLGSIKSSDLASWKADEAVFNILPQRRSPPQNLGIQGRSYNVGTLDQSITIAAEEDEISSFKVLKKDKRRVTAKYKTFSSGTVLGFRRADGLRADVNYTQPDYINPSSGMGELNQAWFADSKRADVLILTKPSLPLPVIGVNGTWDRWWQEGDKAGTEQYALRVMEVARAMTQEVWLPELLETLTKLRPKSIHGDDRLIVYRGSWRSHEDCGRSALPHAPGMPDWYSPGDGPPPLAHQPSLHEILFQTDAHGNSKLRDLHHLFHTLQTIFQNHLVRNLVLPVFGVPYLDLESTLSIWRSGMVGGSVSDFKVSDPQELRLHQATFPRGKDRGLRSSASGDCNRYCIPSPGMAIEEAFIGGLMRIFERGWAANEEREANWVGQNYVSLRDRI